MTTPGITQEEVERALRERDRVELEEATAAAQALDADRPCPVCGGRLDAAATPPALARLVARPALKCPRCDFEAPTRPSGLTELVALAVGIIGGTRFGLRVVLDAQQLTDGGERLARFALGGAILCGAFWLITWARSAGNVKLLGQVIARRRRERRHGFKERAPAWLGENLRELVFAAILYLLLRQFVVEAFVIPTGSMAPTLYGNNYRVTCARCRFPFAVGRGEFEPATGEDSSMCPVCRTIVPFDKGRAQSDGNKIIVNKLLYRLRPPERYEVFVFRYPEKPWQSFIKRVVGLPGETLRILHGDLHADGVLQPKPPHVQDGVWLPVYDGRYPTTGLGDLWAPFDVSTPVDRWKVARDGSRFDLTPPAGAAVWLDYARGADQPGVRDLTPYNRQRLYGQAAVGDLRVRAEVVAASGATVHLATVEDARAVVASFPCGADRGEFTLTANGATLGGVVAPALRPGVATEVAIAYADDRVRLIVDGDTLLDVADPGAPKEAVEFATARVGATNGHASFEAVRVDRDIYYVANGGRTDPGIEEVTVPPDSYFAMGDNSASSADSRNWGFVHEGHIQGRAFLVWWPLLKPFDGRVVR